jgi:hypothetical protein
MITVLTALMLSAAPSDTLPADPCASGAPGPSPRAYVSMTSPRTRDTVVTATICVFPARASAAKIGSYHGEVLFDTTRARVLRVEKPAGGVRVENAGLPGMVKFAGAEPTGFASGQLLRVALRVHKAGTTPAVRLKMIELNGTDGASMLKQLVVTSNRAP